MNEHDITNLNERYVLSVVRAALQDLVDARRAHGAGSPAYQSQLAHSLAFIRGSLEEVLTATLAELERRACDVAADAHARR
jgi:hypothetical protein